MEYKDFFSPSTLEKLNRKSADNLKTMLGDKNLTQTMMSSQQLLSQIAKAEAPYKDKLEKLAIKMVKELYPIIEEEGIILDAKLGDIQSVTRGLDEIKVNKPRPFYPGEKVFVGGKQILQLSKDLTKFTKEEEGVIYYLVDDPKSGQRFYANEKYMGKIPQTNEIKVNKPGGFEQLKRNLIKLVELDKKFYNSDEDIAEIEEVIQYLKQDSNEKELRLTMSEYTLGNEDYYFDLATYKERYNNPLIKESISPESRRRIINAITQGAALRGAFAFYLFKEHLDEIDPSLVEKYNQIMKNSFGIYDDENAIAMMLSLLAQGHKIAGGTSKVIINEIKVNKPGGFEQLKRNLVKLIENDVKNYGYDDDYQEEAIETIENLKNATTEEELKEIIYHWVLGEKSSIQLYFDLATYKERDNNPLLKESISPESRRRIINENTSGITIQARAINFPMLVHELIKGLYELISLQGFKGDKASNQAVVDKVDLLKNEPSDIRYGKFIFDALNDIFAESNYNDPRIREFFFQEVYQLDDDNFISLIENALNENLTISQKRWVDTTLKSISLDLKADDFDSTGLDEIKVNKPDPELAKAYLKISQYIKNGSVGDLDLYGTPLTTLGTLESVGGSLYLGGTPLTSLGNLKSVGGYLDLRETPIISLGNLQSVGGNLFLYRTPITSLGNLKSVGGDLYLRGTPLTSLGNLKSVGGNLHLIGTPLSQTTTEEEIRQQVDVKGKIYL